MGMINALFDGAWAKHNACMNAAMKLVAAGIVLSGMPLIQWGDFMMELGEIKAHLEAGHIQPGDTEWMEHILAQYGEWSDYLRETKGGRTDEQ